MDSHLIDLIRELCRAVTERGREFWWLKAEINRAFEEQGYHLLPRHFYSPIPDPATIAAHNWGAETFPLSKLRFDEAACFDLCRRLRAHAHDIEGLPGADAAGYYWNNPMFTGLDAIGLYGLIREFAPQRIVEIGSGFSTHLSLHALRRNGRGRLTAIEPYPSDKLRELTSELELVTSKLQDTPRSLFETLESNDILFIDSSHVSAMDSDVNLEILQLLPALSQGVLVHVHDIFFPRDYPKHWVDDRRWFWNEQYLLYAFLLCNPSFEVLLPVQYLIGERWNETAAMFTPFRHDVRSGASIWLRRVAGR